MIEDIEKTIGSPPLFFQAAKDGIWEEARTWSYGDGLPPDTLLRDYVRGEYQDLAFEVFFRDLQGRTMYFGIRPLQKKGPRPDDHAFMRNAFKGIFTLPEPGFGAVVDAIARALSMDTGLLLHGEPECVDIGVVNFWKSVGPCTVWKKGLRKTITEKDLFRILSPTHKALLKNPMNHLAVEFRYRTGHPHWIAFDVSEKKGREHVLIPSLVVQKIAWFLKP